MGENTGHHIRGVYIYIYIRSYIGEAYPRESGPSAILTELMQQLAGAEEGTQGLNPTIQIELPGKYPRHSLAQIHSPTPKHKQDNSGWVSCCLPS